MSSTRQYDQPQGAPIISSVLAVPHARMADQPKQTGVAMSASVGYGPLTEYSNYKHLFPRCGGGQGQSARKLFILLQEFSVLNITKVYINGH